MGVEAQIIGNHKGLSCDVVNRNGATGLYVYTSEYLQLSSRTKPLLSDTYGREANQDLAFSGTPEGVHNGTDSSLWTGSSVSGSRVTFNSTNRPRGASTYSVYMDRPVVGEVWEFDNGSPFDLSGYSSLTLWVNVDNSWSSGDSTEVYGWDGSSQVGDSVNIEDYISEGDNDIWQQAAIPLSDMNLVSQSVEAFRFECLSSQGTRPRWYLDDFQIEESGGGESFSAEPNNGTKLHLTELIFSIADNVTGGLSYDKIGGLTSLTSGILARIAVGGEILFSTTIRQLSDFLIAGGEIVNSIDDGANSFFTVKVDLNKTTPTVLDSRSGDKVEIVISDDLGDLLLFNAFVRGKEEILAVGE